MSKDLDTAKLIGLALKGVLSDVVDKVVESTSTVMDSAKNMTNDFKDQNSTVKKPIPTEREFMILFLEQYEGSSIPDWNETESRFDNAMVDSQFKYFKKGWVANN